MTELKHAWQKKREDELRNVRFLTREIESKDDDSLIDMVHDLKSSVVNAAALGKMLAYNLGFMEHDWLHRPNMNADSLIVGFDWCYVPDYWVAYIILDDSGTKDFRFIRRTPLDSFRDAVDYVGECIMETLPGTMHTVEDYMWLHVTRAIGHVLMMVTE